MTQANANDTPGADARPSPQASAEPSGTTAVSSATAETSAEKTIPLPPIPPHKPVQWTPEQLATEIRRLDWSLAGLVLVLAFLLAAFAVRNSDFWMHLATGRLYAHGEFNFGHDPFSYATSGVYWANHAWLYDLVIYGISSLAGGPESPSGGVVLVVLKALLMTALAWIMLKTARPGRSLWAPAACTGLAFVAISSRLLFQPTLVSLLFLGLTIYILQSPRYQEPTPRGQAKPSTSPLARYCLLPVLFALWVNLDDWFLLGPLVVLLYLVGQVVQQFTAPIFSGPDAPPAKQIPVLAIVLVVGLAACLLNPHHYHAFALPGQLRLFSSEIFEHDALFAQIFHSPFQGEYFDPQRPPAIIPVIAYYLLGAAGLVSFAISLSGGWRWWRLLVWLAFFVLSGLQARNIPFFAVVAGPITALNLQDFATRRYGLVARVDSHWKWWSLGGRIATGAVAIILLIVAWPGWLHADWGHGRRPTETRSPHRVAFTIEPDPSMIKAAAQVSAWRREGLLRPDDQGFLCSPDLVNYFAWFCVDETGAPLEKGFFDSRFELFPESITEEFLKVRWFPRQLQEFRITPRDNSRTGPVVPPSDDVALKILRDRHINHIIVYRFDPYYDVFWGWLGQEWRQRPLVYMDGRTSIFSLQDPKRTAGPSSLLKRLDFEALAFGPNAERAPPEGPDHPPQLPEFWKRYLYGQPARPLSEAEALAHVTYYETIRQLWQSPSLICSELATWAGAANLSGLVNPATFTILVPVTRYATSFPIRLIQYTPQGPPASLILAVRASRKAVAANPDDPQALLTLAKTYGALMSQQEERWNHSVAGGPLTLRQKLRQLQIITALESVLKLRPDDQDAHRLLWAAYAYMNFHDLALEHLRTLIELAEATDPPSSEKEQYAKGLDQLRKSRDDYDKQVTRQRDEFEVNAANQPTDAKVGMALSRGLGKKALELLLEIPDTQVTQDEARVTVDLLISTGQLDEVRAKLMEGDSGNKSAVPMEYTLLRAQMDAISGNYQEALAYLDEHIRARERAIVEGTLIHMRALTFQKAGPNDVASTASSLDELRRLAEVRILRGLLALELGDTSGAAHAFRQAFTSVDAPQLDFDGREIAKHYLELIERQSSHEPTAK